MIVMDIQYISLVFLCLAVLSWLILKLTDSKPRDKESRKIFAGGMEIAPGKLNIPETSYYEYLKKFLRADALGELHSGKLRWCCVFIAG